MFPCPPTSSPGAFPLTAPTPNDCRKNNCSSTYTSPLCDLAKGRHSVPQSNPRNPPNSALPAIPDGSCAPLEYRFTNPQPPNPPVPSSLRLQPREDYVIARTPYATARSQDILASQSQSLMRFSPPPPYGTTCFRFLHTPTVRPFSLVPFVAFTRDTLPPPSTRSPRRHTSTSFLHSSPPRIAPIPLPMPIPLKKNNKATVRPDGGVRMISVPHGSLLCIKIRRIKTRKYKCTGPLI
jgi:hypothetical protein